MKKNVTIYSESGDAISAVIHKSARWTLTAFDFVKAAVMFGLSAAGGTILDIFKQHGLKLNEESLWTIGGAVAVGTVSYIIKQFSGTTETIKTNTGAA